MIGARFRQAIAAAAALAMATGLALPATAQTEQQPLQATEVSPDELQSYAAAASEVEAIGQSWQARIDGATTQEEATQMGQQAQTEMIAAVEAEGLSVDRYNQIFQLAQADANVRAQIMQLMEAEQ